MKVLVIWYSRSGNTTKVAREIMRALEEQSDEVHVEKQELKEVGVKREVAVGWLKSGRDATLKRKVSIRPVLFDVSSFDLVVIGTPVWAMNMTPAVRVFCEEHGPSCPRVAFFCTMSGKGDERVYREMTQGCRKQPIATLSVADRVATDRDTHQLAAKVEAFARTCVGGG